MEVRNIAVKVEPAIEQNRIRRQLVSAYYYANKQPEGSTQPFTVEVESGAALLIKLQQISDGFIHDGEGTYAHVKSNKANRLKELCAELVNSGEKVLVWTAFRKTTEILASILPYKTVRLTGDRPFDHETWRKGNAEICLATVGSGASLNDFQDVRYAIFYSCRYSHLNYQQAKGRTDRKSSKHSIAYYYHMASVGFPDQDVYEMLDKSAKAEEYVIRTTTKLLANNDYV